MSGEVTYRAANVTIAKASIIFRGRTFQIADVEEVESYDERPKALRWSKIGLALAGLSMLLAVLATKGQSAAPGGFLGGIGLLMLIFGGGALVIYRLNPTIGTGLILRMRDGYSEIINGLSRKEIEDTRAAIAMRLSAEADRSHPTSESRELRCRTNQ